MATNWDSIEVDYVELIEEVLENSKGHWISDWHSEPKDNERSWRITTGIGDDWHFDTNAEAFAFSMGLRLGAFDL